MRGSSNGGTAGRDRRDVLKIENRQAFGGFPGHRGHDHSVAVGEKQMQVDPGLRVGWKPRRLELAWPTASPADRSRRVRSDQCQRHGTCNRSGSPAVARRYPSAAGQSHSRILSMVARLSWSDWKVSPCSAGKGLTVTLAEIVGLLSKGDVALEVGRLQLQFVRLHIDALE